MDATQQFGSGPAGEPDESADHDYEVIASDILVESPILALRRDMVRMPGGAAGEDRVVAREIVEHFGAVAVVAVDDRGRVALVEQWRQAVGRRLLELPAGLLDVAGEDPLTAAARELAEEAGLAAGRWSLLADIVTSPGFAEEAVRIYLAEDLERVDSDRDLGIAEGEEADLGLEFVPLDQACAMIGDGRILNGIAATGLLAADRVISGRDPRRGADERPFDLRPTRLARRRARMLGGGDLKRVPDTPDAGHPGAGGDRA